MLGSSPVQKSFSNFQLSGSRKLLASLPAPPPRGEESSAWSRNSINRDTLNSHLAVILTAMVCALICALGLNSVLKCARCYRRRIAAHISDAVAIRVGNTGMKKAAMKALPIVIYTSPSKLPPGLSTECSICLTEFGEGEKVRVLPNCNHGFHMECVDKWLASHTSCPMCRHSLNLGNRNGKPEGGAAPISQATESNNGIHVVIESTDSTQAIPPLAEVSERTLQEATGITNSSPLPPSTASENESSSHPMNNVV